MTTVLETLGRPPFDPLRSASLRDLSIKTVFLLSAHRRSAIHALYLRQGHINFESNGVWLVPDPSFLAKNQTIDFLPNPIFIPTRSSFSDTEEDKVWCPVRCLKAYLKATQSLGGSSTTLFISMNKPHAPVSRDTISRWITLAITADPSAILRGEKATAHQVHTMASFGHGSMEDSHHFRSCLFEGHSVSRRLPRSFRSRQELETVTDR